MTSQASMGFTVAQDFASTIIRQKNACPVCHLPLCYGEPLSDSLPGSSVDPDTQWYHAQSVMKHKITQNSYVFGAFPDTVNAQICHLVGTTMIPQITPLNLYTTPVTEGSMAPEDGYYLYPDQRRHAHVNKLTEWDFNVLFPSKKHRMHDYLNISGVHYFIACADCNMAHTGNYQLQDIVAKLFNADKKNHADVYSMYTLMFDCMADEYPDRGSHDLYPVINVTPNRRKFWQVELWMNYCVIMFTAQHHKHLLSDKRQDLGKDMYRFTYSHRDMGMCDFYMNQMLAVILYLNFKIDVDFIWLHQNFLSFIPQWAKHDGQKLFKTYDHDFNCMWRLVLGRAESDGEFCVREDIVDEYWMEQRTNRQIAMLSCKQIQNFTKTWLIPIGHAITHPDPSSLIGHSKSIRELYDQRLNPHRNNLLSTVRLSDVGDPNGKDLIRSVLEDPNIETFLTAFGVFFPGIEHKILFENFVMCALPRTLTAYRKADPRGANYPLIKAKLVLLHKYLVALI